MSIETVRTVPRPAYSTQLMVLILDGNVEIGALVSSNLCYLICLRNLIRSRAVTNQFVFLRKDIFSFMCERNFVRYHLIKVPWHRYTNKWMQAKK